MLAGGFFDLLEVVLPSMNCSLILSIQEGEEEVGKREGTEVQGDFQKPLAHAPGWRGISTELWKCPSDSLADSPSASKL